MNKADQLRDQTAEQLQLELTETRKELLDRAVRTSASADNAGVPRSVLRRKIARILTILREKQGQI